MDFWIGTCAKIDSVGLVKQAEELGGHWCLYGTPDELLQKTQTMREAGCDMVSAFLSNPFTAERDIADIGSSILAHA